MRIYEICSLNEFKNPFLFINFQVLILSFDYQLSADRKYLLLAINYQKVSRSKFPRARSFIYYWPIRRNENFLLPRYYAVDVEPGINFESAGWPRNYHRPDRLRSIPAPGASSPLDSAKVRQRYNDKSARRENSGG